MPFSLTGTGGNEDAAEKNVIPERLRWAYAEVAAKAIELRQLGKTHAEVCEELNALDFKTRTGKPWRHPQQIIKLLRSFGSTA